VGGNRFMAVTIAQFQGSNIVFKMQYGNMAAFEM